MEHITRNTKKRKITGFSNAPCSMLHVVSSSRGIITLEILISLAILVVSVSGVILLSFGNQSVASDSQTNNEGIYLAHTAIENARATGKQDFGQLDSSQPPTITHNSIYTTTTSVLDMLDGLGHVDPYSKKVVTDTTWSVSGRPMATKLSTIVTSPQASLAGDACQVPLTADWSNPIALNSSNIDIGTGNTATGSAVRNGYAYVTASGAGGKASFFVVDVSNSKTPVIKNSIILPSPFQPELDAVFISGNYAYVVGYAHGGFNDQGGTIFVKDSIAYVGTEKGKATQFAIIDISTPTSPSIVAGSRLALSTLYEMFVINATTPSTPTVAYSITGITNQVNLIQVYNNKAYVSNEGFNTSGQTLPDGTHLPNGAGFTVFDVSSTPAFAPTLIGYYNLHDHGYGMVTKDPAHILLGGKAGLGLHMLNATDPMAIYDLDTTPPLIANGRLGGITTSGIYAFLGTQDTAHTFIVMDISDPTNLGIVARIGFDSNSVKAPANGLDCEKNIFYLATDSSSDALKIIGPGPVMIAQIHDSADNDITGDTVNVGSEIHPTVTIKAGTVPTGSATFTRYTNSGCTQNPVAEAPIGLTGGSADGSTYTPPSGNTYYKIDYSGDFTYSPMHSSCLSLKTTQFNVNHGSLSVATNKATVSLTNNGSDPTYISNISINWPTANGKLTNVQLTNNNQNIYTIDTDPPLLVTNSFAVSQPNRTLNVGQPRNFILQFQTNPADNNPSHYSITIEFDGDSTHKVIIP